MTLTELANKYNTDKGTNPAPSMHGYTGVYDLIFSKWRHRGVRLLEIGVVMEGTAGGHSLRMWQDYFSCASIFAMDIVDIAHFENDRIRCFKGNAADKGATDRMFEAFESTPFDIIIEDGSHKHGEQVASFENLWRFVAPGGYYVWEDILNPLCREQHERLYLENQASHQCVVERGGQIIYDMLGRFEAGIFHKPLEGSYRDTRYVSGIMALAQKTL